MVVLIDSKNLLFVNILQERKSALVDDLKVPQLFLYIEDYGTKINFLAEKNSSVMKINYTVPQWSELNIDDVKAMLNSKIGSCFELNANNANVTVSADVSKIDEKQMVEFSKVRYYCLLSKIVKTLRSKPGDQADKFCLQFDQINTLFGELVNESINLTYAINTARADEDQTLMETFMSHFDNKSGRKAMNLISISYSKQKPSALSKFKQSSSLDATYYLSFILKRDGTLNSEKTLEQIICLPHTLHLHMKAAKNCLNLVNGHFLKQWIKTYNRTTD